MSSHGYSLRAGKNKGSNDVPGPAGQSATPILTTPAPIPADIPLKKKKSVTFSEPLKVSGHAGPSAAPPALASLTPSPPKVSEPVVIPSLSNDLAPAGQSQFLDIRSGNDRTEFDDVPGRAGQSQIPPPRTSINWGSRYFTNQSWFNLSSSTKIILMSELAQRSSVGGEEGTYTDAAKFLQFDDWMTNDWLDLCEAEKTFTAAAIEAGQDEGDAGTAFKATQSDINEGKRFILCRHPQMSPLRQKVYDALDRYVDFNFYFPLETIPGNNV
ncbi:hypothetical protein BDZ45DRAFT_689556 [Acephala macrosclerotiorum]|nr:hypothetical protein BDZ45DRAFT_689556 [Acephala macrosclerotiorum]